MPGCSRSPILRLRPLRRLPFRLGCPRLHTSPSTHTHPSPPLIQSVGVDDHKVPPNETDQVQPIDRGMGRQIKVYLVACVSTCSSESTQRASSFSLILFEKRRK